MITKLLFVAALLVPGLAYGGNPSADLSVQVVPAIKAGTCAPLGQAATDAATAGFNTCAFFSDWTAPTGVNWVPSFSGSVATTSNWLDCSFSQTDTTHIWHYGDVDRTNPGGQQFANCNTHIVVTTDPTTGGQVLAERSIYSDLVEGAVSSGYNTIETTNYGNNAPPSAFYPFGYQEVTFRFDTTPTFLVGAFWNSQYHTSTYIERDGWECGGFVGQQCNTEGTQWAGGAYNGFFANSNKPFSGFDPTQWHTWGTLWTGDGNGNYSVCTYVDGVRNGCHLDGNPPGGTNSALAVQESLRLEYAIYNGPCGADGHYTCLPNYGVQTMYIKNVKVLSCANFASSTAMCNGTTSNGNFYE